MFCYYFLFFLQRPSSFSFFIWSCANSRRLPLIALKSLHISLLHWDFQEETNWELFWAGYQITTVFRVPPKGSYIGSHNLSCICSVSDWASRLVPNDISVYPSRDPSLLSRYWLILSDDGKLAQLLSASLDPKGEVNMLRLMWHTIHMPENHKIFWGFRRWTKLRNKSLS